MQSVIIIAIPSQSCFQDADRKFCLRQFPCHPTVITTGIKLMWSRCLRDILFTISLLGWSWTSSGGGTARPGGGSDMEQEYPVTFYCYPPFVQGRIFPVLSSESVTNRTRSVGRPRRSSAPYREGLKIRSRDCLPTAIIPSSGNNAL